MTIERHVFGSFKGCTTLAKSPGVSPEDCRVVERCVYGFGQTYDNRFYKSLSKSPGWFVLQFPGNRRGLTRITEGAADDHGRATILFTSILIAKRDWDGVVLGDIAALLAQKSLWVWDGLPAISALEVEISAKPEIPAKRVGRVLQLVSQLEQAVRTRSRLVLSEQEVTAEDFRAVEMLLPPTARPAITLGWRALSGQLPTTLVCLAREVEGASASHLNEGGALSPYAQMLQQAGIESGTIPLMQVMQYRSFGAAIPAATPMPQAPVMPDASMDTLLLSKAYRRKTQKWAALAGLVALLLGMGGGAGVMYWQDRKVLGAEQKEWGDKETTAKKATTQEVARVTVEERKKVDKIRIQATEDIAEMKTKLQAAETKAKNATDKADQSDNKAQEAASGAAKWEQRYRDVSGGMTQQLEKSATTRPSESGIRTPTTASSNSGVSKSGTGADSMEAAAQPHNIGGGK